MCEPARVLKELQSHGRGGGVVGVVGGMNLILVHFSAVQLTLCMKLKSQYWIQFSTFVT
jgi:hypothetical protein